MRSEQIDAALDRLKAEMGVALASARSSKSCESCAHARHVESDFMLPYCAKWSHGGTGSASVMVVCPEIKFCGAWTPRDSE